MVTSTGCTHYYNSKGGNQNCSYFKIKHNVFLNLTKLPVFMMKVGLDANRVVVGLVRWLMASKRSHYLEHAVYIYILDECQSVISKCPNVTELMLNVLVLFLLPSHYQTDIQSQTVPSVLAAVE